MANVTKMIKFLSVGALNTILGLSTIYFLMYFWGADPFTSNLVGYIFGIFVGYHLNRAWTFRSPKGRFSNYALVAAGSYFVNLSVVFLSISLSVDPYLAQLTGIASYTVLAYLGNTYFVFRN